MPKRPIYYDVYLKIKKMISDGEYTVGDFLPTESNLEKIYGVSKTTVRKVISLLSSDGYIKVKQGSGMRVTNFNSTQIFNSVTSISETLRKDNNIVSIKSIFIDVIKPEKKIAESLKIDENESIYRIQRVILANSIPVAIIKNYIQHKFAPEIDKKANNIESLYIFLEKEYNLQIDSANDTITAKNSDFIESELLNVATGTALISIQRTSFQNDIPITYDESIIRADKYKIEVQTRGRKKISQSI